MTSDLTTSFLPKLIEQTAICLNAASAGDINEQRIAAGDQFVGMRRAHETLRTTISLLRTELVGLKGTGAARAPAIDGLARALTVLRARREGNISWLDLYCTTADSIESINFRSTKSLSRLTDEQLAVVLDFARAASAFLDVAYNRDFEVAGMAVTCDRLVEQGITTEADAFRIETLLQRLESAEQDLADSAACWSAAVEAMEARFEQALANARINAPRRAPVSWSGTLSRWRGRPAPWAVGGETQAPN
jgi:hypothetical protein